MGFSSETHAYEMVSDSDPKKTGKLVLKVEPLEKTAEARKTAKILNELTTCFHEILKTALSTRKEPKKFTAC